jgi:TRAP-type uncharacterized transport system substrate-binding protein
MINFFILLLYATNASAHIQIASGSIYGVYHTLATQECTKLQKPCFVRSTSGSLENIELLKSKKVDYAVIQDNLGTKNMIVVKRFKTKEQLHIFYKGDVKSFYDLMQLDYTLDTQSGTYATLYALQPVFKFKLKTIHRDVQEKESSTSFCDRNTQVSFYNISENSLPYHKMKLEFTRCGVKEYVFTKEEIYAIHKHAQQLNTNNGFIENGVILVRSLY